MSNNLVAKTKSFWDTKEGTTGMVFGLGILGALGYGAFKLMPYIADLMKNTFYAVGFGLAAVGLIYVFVIDGTARNRMWIFYKMMMKAITYSVIKYDPIGILREIQKKARERIDLVDKNRATVRGQIQTIQQTISSFDQQESTLSNSIAYLQRKQNQDEDIKTNAARLGRVHDAKERLQKSLDRVTGFYQQLNKASKALTQINDNIDFEISIMEREVKAVNASHTAWKAVKAAFKGNDQLNELQNDTLNFLTEDYSRKLGEIETFMDDSQKFINGAELQDGMYADAGMKLLEDLNARKLDVIPAKTSTTSAIPMFQVIK